MDDNRFYISKVLSDLLELRHSFLLHQAHHQLNHLDEKNTKNKEGRTERYDYDNHLFTFLVDVDQALVDGGTSEGQVGLSWTAFPGAL